ncbi:tail fiber protein [Pseudomonas phage vB_PpuP-Kompost-2]
MATTTKTVKTYALNGSLKDFTIPFEYLARKFVVVTLIGATRTELVLNSGFRFTTPTQITTTVAWGPGQNYDLIEIRRYTSATERLVDFADGSILRAYDLNTSQVQSLHIAEEARDLTADTIGVNNDGFLDARARKIVNLADGTEPGDAVNLRQQQQWGGSALNQALASAASATASAGSAAASQASNVASDAARAAAVVARTGAEAAQGAAASSATNANAANQTAYEWANKAENQVVNSGQFSAFHWVQKALAWATNSQASATASAASAATGVTRVQEATAQVALAAGQVALATTEANRATTEADRAAAEADALGGMNDMASNIDSAATGAGNWLVTFKGAIKSITKMFATKFEATEDYPSAETSFASQHTNEAPFFVKKMTLVSGSEYRPIIKARMQISGHDESLSLGVLSYVGGAQDAVLHWGGPAGSSVGGPLMQLKRDGTAAAFPGSLSATAVYDNNNRVWSSGNFNPDNKLACVGAGVNGTRNQIAGQTYNLFSAANQVYVAGLEIRENGLVGSGGPSPGHPYNAPSITFHWGATNVQKLFMNAQAHLCWGNPANQYCLYSSDGNVHGSVYGGWITNYIYNTANDRAYAWAMDSGAAGVTAVNNWAGVGGYGFCRTGVTATYGVDVAGGNLTFGSTGANGGGVPGVWRSLGWAGGGNHTLFIRIA